MHSRHVEIKSPCHESWDAMHGDDERRFCDVCAKHVHNLSAMNRESAADLLGAHKGEHLCVRYSNHEDGKIAFRDDPVVPVSRLRSVRTAFAAVMLAACAPHGDSPPIQDLGDITIEAMARDARPSADGGCEVQTGPFTTLHFPADHAVCRHLADRGDMIRPTVEPPPQPPQPLLPPETQPLMGAAPVHVEPPPPVEDVMGKIAPQPNMKMGEAMPEVKEPCDPQHGQGFAPPPPSMGQVPVQVVETPPPVAPPVRELMGDIAVEDIREPEPQPEPQPEPRPKMGKIKMKPSRTGGAVVGDF